jgi:hypothetical protein
MVYPVRRLFLDDFIALVECLGLQTGHYQKETPIITVGARRVTRGGAGG